MKVPLIRKSNLSFCCAFGSDKSDSPLDGDVQVGDVVQDKLDEFLVLLLSNVTDERGPRDLLAELVSNETVLGESVVEVVDNFSRRGIRQLKFMEQSLSCLPFCPWIASCSAILLRSDPPTKAIAHSFLKSFNNWSISSEACYRSE